MNKKDYINIAGVVLTFIACTGAGFGGAYLARMPRAAKDIVAVVDGGNTGGGQTVPQTVPQPGTPTEGISPAPDKSSTAPGTQTAPSEGGKEPSVPSDSLNNGNGTSTPSVLPDGVTQESIDDAATRDLDPDDVCNPDLPMIAKVSGPAMYPTTSPERFGYQLAVTFTEGVRVRGAELLHDGQVKYSSPKGVFQDVMPVKDGKYRLQVTGADGIIEAREVSGFNLMPKWTAGFIAEQLNSTAKDKQFFRHFTPDLKLHFEGISDEGNIPVSLNSLNTSMPAMGWTVAGVRDVVYDPYNRVKSMTVTIKEQ